MIKTDEFTDITYVVEEASFAIITINRPDRMNSFRGRTVDELLSAFKHAWVDPRVAAVILTGAGDRAFCAGGDVKERAETGSYGEALSKGCCSRTFCQCTGIHSPLCRGVLEYAWRPDTRRLARCRRCC